MSESELAVIKPKTLKTYIWLQCFDGSIQQVEDEVAMFCPMICRQILKNGMGSSKNNAIALPERVNPASLSLILDYCRFHQIPGCSNKERKSFDEKFVRIDTEKLCELTSAADSLQLKPLVDLTSRALARIIEGKTPEEIRDIFHLPDDLTEVLSAFYNLPGCVVDTYLQFTCIQEEKLEPLKNINDDPRIRLLNRLYAKKRKELKERQKLKDVEVQEEQKDERSVDEILCFINGDEGSGGGKAAKCKKKNKRRKDHTKNPLKAHSEPVAKEGAACVVPCDAASGYISTNPCQSSDVQDNVDYPFEDADLDDGLDPAMKEELDRCALHVMDASYLSSFVLVLLHWHMFCSTGICFHSRRLNVMGPVLHPLLCFLVKGEAFALKHKDLKRGRRLCSEIEFSLAGKNAFIFGPRQKA